MARNPVSHALAAAALLALAALPAGCSRKSDSAAYESVPGVVEARLAETGELTVRPTDGRHGGVLVCVVTNDTEIYVNDKFSALEAVQVGDRIELLGYRDPSARLARFVVSFAYIRHDEPAPPDPLPLAPPTPASTPQESSDAQAAHD